MVNHLQAKQERIYYIVMNNKIPPQTEYRVLSPENASLLPKVSVCITTYNQASFIRQALLSALEQKTSFPVEIIVGDDASTDGTSDIIREIAAHNSNMKVIFHKENSGGQGNWFAVHNSAIGEFVAHLDGDDYFLPTKLQKQVDFLECHPECSAVGHDSLVLAKSGKFSILRGKHNEFVDIKKLLLGLSPFSQSSFMYRRSLLKLRSPKVAIIDWMLYLDLLFQGQIGILAEPLVVYREGIGVVSRPDKWEILDKGCNNAFDFALSHGCDKELVSQGRALVRFRRALMALNLNLLMKFSKYCESTEAAYDLLSWREKVIWRFRKRGRIARMLLPGLWLREEMKSLHTKLMKYLHMR